MPITKEQLGLGQKDLLVKSESTGYISALGTGIKKVDSKYVAFLDSDDVSGAARLDNLFEAIQKWDADVAIGKISRINESGKVLRIKSIFGEIPFEINPWIKLIFGAYGADSSIMVRSQVIRETWNSHAEFPSYFSDYGWFLGLNKSIKLVNVQNSNYYYRQHEQQISRTKTISVGWSQVHHLWIENIKYCSKSLRFYPDNWFDEELGIAIAFPSSLKFVRLNNWHKFKLINKLLLKDFAELDKSEYKKLKVALGRRGLVATRTLDPRYWVYAPSMVRDLLINKVKGYRYRNGK
jgi:glycosyltransferase involved in cell wall biosynthesis